VVLSAYRELAAEGLVELRERSGAYVAADPASVGSAPGMAEAWVVDIFAQAIAREISPSTLVAWMQHSLATRPLRAGVIAGTDDQLLGLCRELEADYGLEADGVTAASLGSGAAVPPALAGEPLELSADGAELVYTFDGRGEHTGIPDLLRRLGEEGIDFTDLQTRQSSLEDIFVDLVRERA